VYVFSLKTGRRRAKQTEGHFQGLTTEGRGKLRQTGLDLKLEATSWGANDMGEGGAGLLGGRSAFEAYDAVEIN